MLEMTFFETWKLYIYTCKLKLSLLEKWIEPKNLI